MFNLTETEKKSEKGSFSKIQKLPSVWFRGSYNENLKDIRALGIELSIKYRDSSDTDDGQTNV